MQPSSIQALGPNDVPTTPPQTDATDVNSVYQALVRGVGHEFVTDDNVDELIRRAEADSHPVLAAELREWRSPCGDDSNRTAAR
jgi:hypothetical protein